MALTLLYMGIFVNIMKTYGELITPKGKFTYSYFLFHNNAYHFDTYAFSIWDENDKENKRAADFSLLIMDDHIHLKVIDLFMNDYQRQGIAQAIILKASEIFDKIIISSSNTMKSFTGESNWPEAIERVWQPLVAKGAAYLDIKNDRYVVIKSAMSG